MKDPPRQVSLNCPGWATSGSWLSDMRHSIARSVRRGLQPVIGWPLALRPDRRESVKVIPHGPERSVLVVAEWNEDYCRLRSMLSQFNWASDWASTYAEAITRLETKGSPVVICEQKLPDGSWSDFIQKACAVPDPPLVIVASAQVHPSLFDEVRSHGGMDVLTRPFEGHEVPEVLSNARREWHRRTKRNGSS